MANVLNCQLEKVESTQDKLYLVLKCKKIEDCTIDNIKYILGSILVAKIPLTGVGLDSLQDCPYTPRKLGKMGCDVRSHPLVKS